MSADRRKFASVAMPAMRGARWLTILALAQRARSGALGGGLHAAEMSGAGPNHATQLAAVGLWGRAEAHVATPSGFYGLHLAEKALLDIPVK